MKKMTPAQQKAHDARVALNKNLPEVLVCSELSCVVFKGLSEKGLPVARGYTGRSTKAKFFYRFANEASRDDYVNNFMDSEKAKALSKPKKATAERVLEVGDVLRSSWGYDQTNVDYYLVTALVGASSVTIVEIGSKAVTRGNMCGTCVPDTSKIIGEPMTKRAMGDRVRIASYATARKEEFKEVDGVKIYTPTYHSSYA